MLLNLEFALHPRIGYGRAGKMAAMREDSHVRTKRPAMKRGSQSPPSDPEG